MQSDLHSSPRTEWFKDSLTPSWISKNQMVMQHFRSTQIHTSSLHHAVQPSTARASVPKCHHLSTTQLGVCKPAWLWARSTSRNISTPLPLPFSLRYQKVSHHPGGKQHQVVKQSSEDRTRGCSAVRPWQICQMSSFKWGFCQEEAGECCEAAMACQPSQRATGMLPRCLSWPPCLNIHEQGNGAYLNATAESVLFLLRNCFHHSLYKR